jgi:chromosome segregation ATPase
MFISCSFIQMAQVNPHSECVEYLDELASVIGRLDDKTRKLLVENTKLRRNNEELKTQNEELTSETVEDLKSDIEDLESENQELTSENEKLKKQLEEFKQKIMQLNFVLKIMGHPQSEPESDED